MKIYISLILCLGVSYGRPDITIPDNFWTNLDMTTPRHQQLSEEYETETNVPLVFEDKDKEVDVMTVSSIQKCDEKIDRILDILANFVSKDGKTALHYAISKGDERMAEDLIRHGANTNAQDNLGDTPLLTVSTGHENLADLLIKKGADASITDSFGVSILDRAIENDDEKLVDVLLSNGAFSVNAKTFFAAVSNDKEKIAEKILTNGGNVNLIDEDGRTALHLAASSGSEKVIDLLIKYEIDVNVMDTTGATALHKAAEYGYSKIAEVLINNGIDVNAKDHHGFTALHRSVQHGINNVTEVLIKHGAKLHVVNKDGYTPLKLISMMSNGYNFETNSRLSEFNETLIKLGKSFDSSQDDICAIIETISDGDYDVMRTILQRQLISADNICSDLGEKTPLIKAAEIGDVQIFDYLIDIASVNFANPSGVTALHAAAINDNEHFVRSLINYGALINLRDKHGCTPLMRAAEFNREDIVKLLLEKGAHKYDTDHYDHTAEAWARAKGYEELGELIKNWERR